MKRTRINKRAWTGRGAGGFAGFMLLSLFAQAVQAAPQVTDIEFSSRPGSKFEIRLDFNEAPPEPRAYTIEEPARIAIDFPGVTSALERKRYSLPYGNATGVVVLESGDRTRMVVNLVKLVPYETRTSGNSLYLIVGQDASDSYLKQASDPNRIINKIEPVAQVESEILDLQFHRSGEGEGRLTLDLSDPSVDVNVYSEGGKIKVSFLDTAVPERLMRRFDVTDFATPVQSVDVRSSEAGTTLTLETSGDFDYLAYQTDGQYVSVCQAPERQGGRGTPQ